MYNHDKNLELIVTTLLTTIAILSTGYLGSTTSFLSAAFLERENRSNRYTNEKKIHQLRAIIEASVM